MASSRVLLLQIAGPIRSLLSWLLSAVLVVFLSSIGQADTVDAFLSSRTAWGPRRANINSSGQSSDVIRGDRAIRVGRDGKEVILKPQRAVSVSNAQDSHFERTMRASPFSSARRSVCATCPKASCDGCPLAGEHGGQHLRVQQQPAGRWSLDW